MEKNGKLRPEDIKIIKKKLLPNGNTALYFPGKGKFTYPALKDETWQEQISRKLCNIQYDRRRDKPK